MRHRNCRFVYSKVKEISVGNEFVLRGPRNDLRVMHTDGQTQQYNPNMMIPGSNYMAHTNRMSASTMAQNREMQFLNAPAWPNLMG